VAARACSDDAETNRNAQLNRRGMNRQFINDSLKKSVFDRAGNVPSLLLNPRFCKAIVGKAGWQAGLGSTCLSAKQRLSVLARGFGLPT
jgi:hypothetical protein